MNTKTFNKIRVVGYAIPTTSSGFISIGDPDSPGAVAGPYLGNADFQTNYQYFAEGVGEVHIFGLKNSYILY